MTAASHLPPPIWDDLMPTAAQVAEREELRANVKTATKRLQSFLALLEDTPRADLEQLGDDGRKLLKVADHVAAQIREWQP